MKDNITEEDGRSALLVRDAMDSAVADLTSPHDLVPAAVTQGWRRKAHARLAIAAGIACVAGAVVFGSLALTAGDDARTAVRPATSGTPSPHESVRPEPYRTPVHIDPTSDDERSMAHLPPTERKRRAQFQQDAAVLLDKLLPDSVGLIRPVDLDVSRYQGKRQTGRCSPSSSPYGPPATARNRSTAPRCCSCRQGRKLQTSHAGRRHQGHVAPRDHRLVRDHVHRRPAASWRILGPLSFSLLWLTAATIRSDRSRGRWLEPDDYSSRAHRWYGESVTRTLADAAPTAGRRADRHWPPQQNA
ncbi:hypothetical protein [Streptomyces sp. NPDC002573]|uniref:hypothetical protein n=1 Tax=Streptomyces sp. NPDC002573 TaxID=3364651 RepID=UPI003679D518